MNTETKNRILRLAATPDRKIAIKLLMLELVNVQQDTETEIRLGGQAYHEITRDFLVDTIVSISNEAGTPLIIGNPKEMNGYRAIVCGSETTGGSFVGEATIINLKGDGTLVASSYEQREGESLADVSEGVVFLKNWTVFKIN